MGRLWFISTTKKYLPKPREKTRIFKLYLGGQEKLRLHSEKMKCPNLLTLSSIGSEILKQSTDGMYFSLKFFQLSLCHKESLVNENPFSFHPHPWSLPDRWDVTLD